MTASLPPDIAERYGPEIAEEVAQRLSHVISSAGPALLAYADTLADYFARWALWEREMKAWRARNIHKGGLSVAPEEVRQRRRAASLAAGGNARGEANPHAKLGDAQVRSIRQRRQAGEKTTAIAADHGISTRLVNLIASRQRWAHVPD